MLTALTLEYDLMAPTELPSGTANTSSLSTASIYRSPAQMSLCGAVSNRRVRGRPLLGCTERLTHASLRIKALLLRYTWESPVQISVFSICLAEVRGS